MIGDILKSYRLEHNMTQSEMAKKIGICLSYYNQIEKNKVKPGILTIRLIAKVLKLDQSIMRGLL